MSTARTSRYQALSMLPTVARSAMSHTTCYACALGLLIVASLYGIHSLLRPAVPGYSTEFYFGVPPSNPVSMHIEDSARYQLDETGAMDYARLQPLGGHLVFVGDSDTPQAYTVTMLHQLKCLEIYHREYLSITASFRGRTASATPSRLLEHCMNYLRQTILCRVDVTLESVRSAKAQSDRAYESYCNDWTAVYREVERNQASIREWKESRHTHNDGSSECAADTL